MERRNMVWKRSLIVPVAAALALAACEGSHAAPDGRDSSFVMAAIEETPPTLDDAASATYWGGLGRQVTLANGEWQGPDGIRVRLVRDHFISGDLEGDGAVDTVVVLVATGAGAETGTYLAVLRHLGADTISLGTALLGHPVEVRHLSLDGRRVVVDMSRTTSAGVAEEAREVYQLGRGELVKVSS